MIHESYHRWHTPRLQREFEMLVFGYTGMPIIMFPTSYNRYYEYKDRGIINTMSGFIHDEKIKIYCPDSIDQNTWYNKKISPLERINGHKVYEDIILNEIYPRACYETGRDKVALVSCSFGALHAANLAFRYPDKFSHLVCLSAGFDIRPFIDDWYGEEAYFMNPVDYMTNIDECWHLENIRNIHIILSAGEHDICKNDTLGMSKILNTRNIHHTLDIVQNYDHDWGLWHHILPKYLSDIT